MIRLNISGQKEQWHASVPDAVAACRRYFMAGGTYPCVIEQDGLIYTITLRPDWNMEKMP